MWIIQGPPSSSSSPHTYYYLPEGEFTIGRDDQCDIVIKDPSASRTHAVLYVRRNQRNPSGTHSLSVVDKSSCGTWLEGKRITKNEETSLSSLNSSEEEEDDAPATLPSKTSPLQLFFAQRGPYKVYHHQYKILPTGLAPTVRTKLSKQAAKLGIEVLKNWTHDCTHACVPQEQHPITIKLLLALVNGKPVITSDWLFAWGPPHRKTLCDPPPEELDYVPSTSVTDGYDYSPKRSRKTMLAHLSAVYADESPTAVVLKEAGAEVHTASSLSRETADQIVVNAQRSGRNIILISKKHEEQYESLWEANSQVNEIMTFLESKNCKFVSEYDVFQSIAASSTVGTLAEASQPSDTDREYLKDNDLPIFNFRTNTRKADARHSTKDEDTGMTDTDRADSVQSNQEATHDTPENDQPTNLEVHDRVSGGALGKWASVRNGAPSGVPTTNGSLSDGHEDGNTDDASQADVKTDVNINKARRNAVPTSSANQGPNFKAFRPKSSQKTGTVPRKRKTIGTKRAEEFEERQLPAELKMDDSNEEEEKDKFFDSALNGGSSVKKRSAKELLNQVKSSNKSSKTGTENVRPTQMGINQLLSTQESVSSADTAGEDTIPPKSISSGTLRKKPGTKGRSKVKLI
eukprot:gb/GECG01011890.1/.p1 GENE.gb/GECG01011890.1/~~gb/GECG01011890.1/.p1  ORF type:complete len:631 (+),score=91.89 gb/GECG01011890.1/:1-1893(+)